MSEDIFGIVVEITHDLQRDQIQELVKKHADTWWHGMADLWMVKGKSAVEWRDIVGPIFPKTSTGKLLVIKLDADSGGSWAYRAEFSDSAREWITTNL